MQFLRNMRQNLPCPQHPSGENRPVWQHRCEQASPVSSGVRKKPSSMDGHARQETLPPSGDSIGPDAGRGACGKDGGRARQKAKRLILRRLAFFPVQDHFPDHQDCADGNRGIRHVEGRPVRRSHIYIRKSTTAPKRRRSMRLPTAPLKMSVSETASIRLRALLLTR